MPAVYSVAVYKGDPEDKETWRLEYWEYGRAELSPLKAAEAIAGTTGLKGLPSTESGPWLFYKRDKIYEVENLATEPRTSIHSPILGFMSPQQRETLAYKKRLMGRE